MDYIAIGTVYGSHGVRGHLKVGSFSGEFDHFRVLENVQLRSGDRRREFVVQEVRVTERHALMKLEGIESPEEAKAWYRWELWVPREQACPLGEGEYYASDLHGLQVVCGGETVGTVVAVWDGGAGDLLEIERPDGSRAIVPFLARFVGEVDFAGAMIELKAPWVLE